MRCNKFESERNSLDKLSVSSILLAIIGIVSIIFGGIYVSTPRIMTYQENFIGMTHEEISEINPKLAEQMLNYLKIIGANFIGFGILAVAVSLKSYRKGEKWAWYALLISMLVVLLPASIISYNVGAQQSVMLGLAMIVVLLVAIALPIKEVFG